MTRLSSLRLKLFAHKLVSSTSDNFQGSDKIDALLSQSRLGYETMLTNSSGERVDQRRSASSWQIIYRQWVVAPPSVVMILDINPNRHYNYTILSQINQIINYTIRSCEQLWIECIIIHSEQWDVKEYVCEWLESAIIYLNEILHNTTDCLLASALHRYHNEYYNYHTIIISDRLSWVEKDHKWQIQNLINNHQALWYVRDYDSVITRRITVPHGLIQLKYS